MITAYFGIYSRLLCVKVAFLCFVLTPLALLKSLYFISDHLLLKNLLRTLKWGRKLDESTIKQSIFMECIRL